MTADHPDTAEDENYTYDAVGNRKTATQGSLGATSNTRFYDYATGTNRLADIRIGSPVGPVESSFTHDFEGRLTTQTGTGAKTLTWDAKGRVKTLAKSGTTENYAYDAMDYRIGRSGGSLGNLAYFLEGEHLESVYSGINLQAKYLRGSTTDELVAGYLYDTDSKLKPFLFHHDNVTSTTAVSGHNGGTIQATRYGAFGNVQSTTGTSPNRLKYTGREDDGTGLYYYRARSYDPTRGQFISEDPMGFGAGVNFYAYVGNNPVNGNDPSGLCPVCLLVEGAIELGSLARNAFTVVNAARTATTISQAAVIGAGTSVAVGGAIRGATGQTVFDPSAMSFDAMVGGAFGVGGQAYNALRIAGSSAVAKGSFAAGLAAQQLGKSVVGTEVSVASGGARPRLDFLTQVGSDLVGFEAKYGNASLTSAQTAGYGAINAGESSMLFGARAGNFAGLGVSQVNVLRFGAMDASPGFSSVLGGAAGGAAGGFLLYPNKANTNMMQSVYSK